MDGILNGLPPGILGYVQGQRETDRRNMVGAQNAQALVGMQGALMQQYSLADQIAQRQRQQAYLNDYAGTLPPEQRGMFLAAPDKFVDRTIEAQFRQPRTQADTTGVLRFVDGPQAGQPVRGFETPEIKTAPDATGVLRYVTGPQSGQPVQGFGTPKAPEGFQYDAQGQLQVIPEWLRVRRDLATAGRPQVNNNILPPQKTFENEDKLRADYASHHQVKLSSEMQGAFNLIETAYKNPTPANDLAMATKYMKILDPTSVVRESELGLALGATGLIDRVRSYAELLATGKKLTPSQREDFYQSAKAINDAFQTQRAQVDKQFASMAEGYGLNPLNVVPSLRTTQPLPPAPNPPTAPKIRKFNPQTGRIE